MGSVKKRNKFRNFLLVFMTLVVCVGLASVGYMYNYLSSFGKNSEQNTKIKPIAAKNDETVNILAMGVDIGTPGSKSKNDPKRTDTIILMNYNPKIQEINLVSIPRDTLIQMGDKYKKINEANAIGGPAYLIDAVQKLLDIKVNYYGKIDYEAFRKLVDTIGPIQVKINNKMDYDDAAQDLHIHFKKGEVVQLDGKKAEEFFRWRKNNDGSGLADGDIGRIENQHVFISNVIERLKSPSIISKIPSILSIMPNYVESNMSAEDIIKYGYLLSKSDSSKVNMTTLKGDAQYISGISYLVYDENKNKDILSKLHSESAINYK